MLALWSSAWRASVHGAAQNAGGAAGEGSEVPAGQENDSGADASCHSAYWPQHELDTFILQMAGHGHAVRTAMMLGDAAYAREQLAAALAMGCPELRALSARLSAYFDRPPCAGGADGGADGAADPL